MTNAKRGPDERDHDTAIAWACNLVKQNDWVILDTETTGIETSAEIVEIAIISPHGKILLNTRVRPSSEIEPGAFDTHGLDAEQLANAPTAYDIWADVQEIIEHKVVVAYNAAFDQRMLKQTAARYGLDYLTCPKWECAMLQYAAYCGEWSDRFDGYKYQPLPNAGHSAAADCQATLALIRHVLSKPSKEVQP